MGEKTGRALFNAKVYELVRSIPEGRVMAYGEVAKYIPPPQGMAWTAYASVRARWVGYALAACPDDVPWQRVINAQGRVSGRPGLGPGLQRHLLEEEAVSFDAHQRVRLSVYGWEPDTDWLLAHGFLTPEP
jgi:methylated-DNA-protein-cysteine methyltransferase-like protein